MIMTEKERRKIYDLSYEAYRRIKLDEIEELLNDCLEYDNDAEALYKLVINAFALGYYRGVNKKKNDRSQRKEL